ncbi:hypothetical protein KCU89_g16342, partial [Aureobasidium melanogenum]
MESLPRGSRVMPPCDRCRRLKMDCLKNLSSCGGCTKKHARCHWKEVSREEVQGLDGFEEAERVANEYANGTRRFSAEYLASDTSMDVDTRSPFDYPSHTGASTPGGLGVQGFSRPQTTGYPEVQQQNSYPPPQAPQQQQGYEDPNNNNNTYRPSAPAPAPRPFPEDLTQQQQQTQQQQDRTMDLLRVLGNHNNGISSSSPVPTNPTPAPVTDNNTTNNQNRNNGAFRSSFTPANEVPAGASGHVGNATNGQGANIMTPEVPSATGEAQRV